MTNTLKFKLNQDQRSKVLGAGGVFDCNSYVKVALSDDISKHVMLACNWIEDDLHEVNLELTLESPFIITRHIVGRQKPEQSLLLHYWDDESLQYAEVRLEDDAAE